MYVFNHIKNMCIYIYVYINPSYFKLPQLRNKAR